MLFKNKVHRRRIFEYKISLKFPFIKFLKLKKPAKQILNEEEILNLVDDVESSSARTSLIGEGDQHVSVASEGKKDQDSKDQLNNLSLESLIQVVLPL